MNTSPILEKSIIVAGHPDDEILWFSSLIDKVDEIVLCFLDIRSEPHYRTDRGKILSEHPIRNISCIGLPEAETFYSVDWKNPVITKFGLHISERRFSDEVYKRNYYALKEYLGMKLINYRNVITHNPWGEYGHEEHIQIYRVIRELQQDMQFDLWFDNSCSNKSFQLMLDHMKTSRLSYVSYETNRKLALEIKDLYQRHNSWTWYHDWEWPREESFLREATTAEGDKGHQRFGWTVPLNLIRIWVPDEPIGGLDKLRSFISSIAGSFR